LYANISQNYRSVTFSDIRTATPGLVIDPNITDEKGFTSDIGLREK
jgi:Fe(3+) dicitrate transport protein